MSETSARKVKLAGLFSGNSFFITCIEITFQDERRLSRKSHVTLVYFIIKVLAGNEHSFACSTNIHQTPTI